MMFSPNKSSSSLVAIVITNLIIFLLAYGYSRADMLEAIFITYFSFAGLLLHHLVSYIWYTVTRLKTFFVAKVIVAAIIAALILPWFGVIALPAVDPLTGTEDAIENLSWIVVFIGVIAQLFFGTGLHRELTKNTHELTMRVITTFVNIGIIFMVLTSFSVNLSIEEIRWLVVAVQLLYISNYIANDTSYTKYLISFGHGARTDINWRNSVDPFEMIIKVVGYGLIFLPSIIIILSVT